MLWTIFVILLVLWHVRSAIVVCITLPPLRQRRDEIPLLTELFLQQYAVHYNKPRLVVSAETLKIFSDYDWPGNVRELENMVKRIVNGQPVPKDHRGEKGDDHWQPDRPVGVPGRQVAQHDRELHGQHGDRPAS